MTSPARPGQTEETILLPDGYNGHMVLCLRAPLETDGDYAKLRVDGSYLIRWCPLSALNEEKTGGKNETNTHDRN